MCAKRYGKKNAGKPSLHFSVSEIKRQKGGGIEVKFFDRLKALEKLESLCLSDSNDSVRAFYSAIEKGTDALKGEENG